MRLAWYDTEPEEVALLARWWWFGSIVTALCIFLGALAIGFFSTSETLLPSEQSDTRVEQKLLDKKALDSIIREYEMRKKKSSSVESSQ